MRGLAPHLSMKPKASSKNEFDLDFKDFDFMVWGLAPHLSMKPKASSKKDLYVLRLRLKKILKDFKALRLLNI